MSGSLYVFSICLPFVTVLLVFGMRYYSAVQQARVRLASDTDYRRIADQAALAATETAASLAEIRSRLTAIEKILKEVE